MDIVLMRCASCCIGLWSSLVQMVQQNYLVQWTRLWFMTLDLWLSGTLELGRSSWPDQSWKDHGECGLRIPMRNSPSGLDFYLDSSGYARDECVEGEHVITRIRTSELLALLRGEGDWLVWQKISRVRNQADAIIQNPQARPDLLMDLQPYFSRY